MDDGDNFFKGEGSERQVGKEAGGRLLDKAGIEHEFMAGHGDGGGDIFGWDEEDLRDFQWIFELRVDGRIGRMNIEVFNIFI